MFFEPKLIWRSRGAAMICAIAILAFVALAGIQAGKPLQLDNMDFPAVAAATAQSGVPVYYRGEDDPQDVGLYHPPLYIYALAGWFKLFGTGPVPARMFDVLCAILAGFIALRIVREIFGGVAVRKIAPTFFIVYLLNPFALQVFSIADIDTSIYVPLILLAIWTPLRFIFVNGEMRTAPLGWRDYAFGVLVFLLCFWAKLTTTLSLPLIFAALLSIRLGVGRSIIATLVVTTTAAALFVLTYSIYGDVTGLDVNYTWSFLLQSVNSKSGAGAAPLSRLAVLADHLLVNAIYFVRWGLLLAVVCACAAEIELGRNVVKTAGVERARWIAALVILTYAAFVVGAYSLVTLPFAGAPFKYIAPVWPLIALGAAWALHQLSSSISHPPRVLAAGALVAAGAGFVTGSVYLRDAALLDNEIRFWRGVAIVVAACLAATLWAHFRSPERSPWLIVRRFAGAAAVAFLAQGLGAAVYQARADYATQYDYGQTGFDQTRNWLRQNTAPDEVVMSMKDLGFAADRRYLENYLYIYDERYDLELFKKNVDALGIRVFIFTEGRGQDQLWQNPELSRWIAQNTTKSAQFGNYVIYRKA